MLSPKEVERIQMGAGILTDLSSRKYTYDKNDGTRYTKDDVESVLQLAGDGHDLTAGDVAALDVSGQFTISKATLVALGSRFFARTATRIHATKFAILVLLWGYASQGYGLYRVERIVQGGALRLPDNTLNSFQALKMGALENAYQYWCGDDHIHGLGESFFSKILFFLAKVASPAAPLALIKDATTSKSAADLFGIETLVERNLSSYLKYVEAIKIAAEVTQMTPERVEEVLFSAVPGQCQRNKTKESTLSCGFGFSKALQQDYNPPAFANDDYVEAGPDEQGFYRIMLVGDGKPRCGKLPEMAYSPEMRPLLDGFYSAQRATVIREANKEANRCRQGTPTYVMTTGYGPVPVTAAMNLYNVPGQKAISLSNYWNLYRRALTNILTIPATAKKILVVYYAGVSKRDFRNGVFKIFQELIVDQEANGQELCVCMYGARQQLSDKWDNLCTIFNSLSSGNLQSIKKMKHDWLTAHKGVSAFFEWCWNGEHIS